MKSTIRDISNARNEDFAVVEPDSGMQFMMQCTSAARCLNQTFPHSSGFVSVTIFVSQNSATSGNTGKQGLYNMNQLFNNKCKQATLLLTVVFVLVGCNGGSKGSSEVNSSTILNPYDNGYRLIKVTGDNLLFDSVDYSTIYQYSADGSRITRTTTYDPLGDPRTYERNFDVDAAGMLTGGTFMVDGDTDTFAYAYNEDGQITLYDRGYYQLDFQYQDGKLIQVVDDSVSTVEVIADFSYDPVGKLISVYDSVLNTTTSFEYNTAGQMTRASEITGFGEAAYTYEYEYDSNGNLSKQTQVRPFGDIYLISLYEYEKANRPMYNHPLFRLAMQPFYGVVLNYISE